MASNTHKCISCGQESKIITKTIGKTENEDDANDPISEDLMNCSCSIKDESNISPDTYSTEDLKLKCLENDSEELSGMDAAKIPKEKSQEYMDCGEHYIKYEATSLELSSEKAIAELVSDSEKTSLPNDVLDLPDDIQSPQLQLNMLKVETKELPCDIFQASSNMPAEYGNQSRLEDETMGNENSQEPNFENMVENRAKIQMQCPYNLHKKSESDSNSSTRKQICSGTFVEGTELDSFNKEPEMGMHQTDLGNVSQKECNRKISSTNELSNINEINERCSNFDDGEQNDFTEENEYCSENSSTFDTHISFCSEDTCSCDTHMSSNGSSYSSSSTLSRCSSVCYSIDGCRLEDNVSDMVRDTIVPNTNEESLNITSDMARHFDNPNLLMLNTIATPPISLRAQNFPETIEPRPSKCSCRHRSPFTRLSPPCYSCTSRDLPPKYKEVNKSAWYEVRRRINTSFQKLGNFVASGSWTNPPVNNAPFTISDGMLTAENTIVLRDNGSFGVRNDLSSFNIETQDMSDSINTAEQQQNLSDNFEGGTVIGTQSSIAMEMTNSIEYITNGQYSGENTIANDGQQPLHDNEVLGVPTNPPPYQTNEQTPPPYSPPLLTSFMIDYHSQNITERQYRQNFETAAVEITRSCQCNIFYSVLLGVVTTVGIFGTEMPIALLACSVTFFAFLVYMPLIVSFECLLQWRNRGLQEEQQPPIRTANDVSPSIV